MSGVAELADRRADPRRVARWMALVACVCAALGPLAAERLLATADRETEGGPLLRALASDAAPTGPPGRVVVLLVDGLRRDEAARLPAWRRLAPESVTGTVALDEPTLSRPYYHALFTGVPQDASGVRSNRFGSRARHDSVMDRVRAAGGEVTVVAEGLDWMRRMHGPAGGSDARDALEGELAVRGSPGLLVVHVVSTDRTAHEEGIRAASHRDALALTDAVLSRLARIEDATLVVTSDHGHLDEGGHGGLEPIVARAPLLVRAPGLAPSRLDAPVRAPALAPTLSHWLGVARPRSATEAPPVALVGGAGEDEWYRRATALVVTHRALERARLSRMHRWILPPLAFALFALIGPIKRGFGLDRAVPVAMVLWPALLLGLHVAMGRPLSLSAIDARPDHVARVLFLGASAAVLAIALALPLARGALRLRLARVAATVGWSQLAVTLLALAWVGFALGPWPLSPLERYLPLLLAGASAAALPVVAVSLYASAWGSGAR